MTLKPNLVRFQSDDLSVAKNIYHPASHKSLKPQERSGIAGSRKVILTPIENSNKSQLPLHKVPSADGYHIPFIDSATKKGIGINNGGKLIGGIRDLNANSVDSKDQASSTGTNARELHLAYFKRAAIKPNLFNQKHLNMDPVVDKRRLNFDIELVTKFFSKYEVEFIEGYTDKLLTRCLDLLNTETDVYVLESNFPGQFTEYLPERKRGLGIINNLNNSMAATRTSSNSNFPATPVDENKSQVMKSSDLQKQIGKYGFQFNAQDKTQTSISSNFSFGNLGIQLPKMDLEQFRNTLLFYSDYKSSGKFFFIKSVLKGATIEFGFVEVKEDPKKKMGYLTKFYIPRIYRKMKMIVPISISLFRFLFRFHGFEKLTLDVISESETLQEELQVIGFKLEKVQVTNEKKYRQFSLKKKDFYDFLDEFLPNFSKGHQDPISVYK